MENTSGKKSTSQKNLAEKAGNQNIKRMQKKKLHDVTQTNLNTQTKYISSELNQFNAETPIFKRKVLQKKRILNRR